MTEPHLGNHGNFDDHGGDGFGGGVFWGNAYSMWPVLKNWFVNEFEFQNNKYLQIVKSQKEWKN